MYMYLKVYQVYTIPNSTDHQIHHDITFEIRSTGHTYILAPCHLTGGLAGGLLSHPCVVQLRAI